MLLSPSTSREEDVKNTERKQDLYSLVHLSTPLCLCIYLPAAWGTEPGMSELRLT